MSSHPRRRLSGSATLLALSAAALVAVSAATPARASEPDVGGLSNACAGTRGPECYRTQTCIGDPTISVVSSCWSYYYYWEK